MDSIIQEWNLTAPDLHSKDDILAALAQRISDMLTQDPMSLIQTMYRLDIPEAQLDAALDSDQAAALIAQLVWDRQLQKQAMRASMPTRPADADDELAW